MNRSILEKLLKIPVIGQMAALAVLPKELDRLKNFQAETGQQFRDLQVQAAERDSAEEEKDRGAQERWEATTRTFDSLGQQIRDIQAQSAERWKASTDTFDSFGQQFRDLQAQAAERERTEEEQGRAAQERWEATTRTFDSLGEHIRDVQAQLAEAREELLFSKGFERLLENGPELSELRSRLSIHPAVWGPADRLKIDPEASVDACLFNTNSGSITVGRYTFAGPGVSLIAGSHDIRLTGFPRRDLQQEDGCNIRIGEGVWLCANCTVLGPCRIGDHAVIAAGAVVTPGTEVEDGCLYVGVPARKVRKISEAFRPEEMPAEIFKRFGGCLYTEGWHTAEIVRTGGEEHTGHWMIREEAEILCLAGERTLRYISPMGGREDRSLELALGEWRTERKPGGAGELLIPPEAFGENKTGTLKLRISRLVSPENGDLRRFGLFIYQE